MSLVQESQIESSVYICSFQCTVRQATIMMKFPCSYFVQWTTSGGKSVAITSRYKPEQNHVHINQKLHLTTQMIYNHHTSEYSKKETLIELFLVSKSRPDQNKLVGRVSVDLAKIINFDMYAQPTQFKLNFCSVQGSLVLQFSVTEQKLTSMKVQDLDRSSFIDYISQVALKQPRGASASKVKDPITSKIKDAIPKVKDSLFKGKLSVISGPEENQAKISGISDMKVPSPSSVSEKRGYFGNKNGFVQNKQISQSLLERKNKEEAKNKIVSRPNRITFGEEEKLIRHSQEMMNQQIEKQKQMEKERQRQRQIQIERERERQREIQKKRQKQREKEKQMLHKNIQIEQKTSEVAEQVVFVEEQPEVPQINLNNILAKQVKYQQNDRVLPSFGEQIIDTIQNELRENEHNLQNIVNKQLAQVKEHTQHLNEKLQEKERQIELSTRQIVMLNGALEEKQAMIRQTVDKNEKAQNLIQRYEQQIEHLNNQALKKQIERQNSPKQSYEDAVKRYVEEIDNLNNENIMYSEEILKNQGIINELQQKIQLQDETIQNLNKKLKDQEEKCSALELNAKNSNKNDDSKHKLEQVKKLLEEKELKCNQLLEINKNLQKYQSQNNELQQTIQLLEEKNLELIQNKNNPEGNNKQQQFLQRLSKYQTQIVDLNQVLIQFESKQAQHEEKYLSFENKVQQLEEKIKNNQKQIQKGQKDRQAIRSDQQKYEKLTQESNQIHQKLQNKVNELELMNADLQGQLSSKNNLSKESSTSLNQMLGRKNSEINLLKNENTSIQNQISQLMSQNMELLQEKQNITNLNTQQQSQIDELNKKVLILNEQIKLKSEDKSQEKLVNDQKNELQKIYGEIQFVRQSLRVSEQTANEEKQKATIEQQILLAKIKFLQKQNMELERAKKDQQNCEKPIKQTPTEKKDDTIFLQKIANLEYTVQRYRQEVEKMIEKQSHFQDQINEQKLKNNEFVIDKQNLNTQIQTYLKQIQNLELENNALKNQREQESLASQQLSPKYEQNWQDRCQEYQMRLSKLNLNLEEQINQNNELSETILKYMQKQAKMKQTLSILQQQSKDLFGMFQEKQQNQQTYQKMIQDLQKEMERMSTNLYQINNQIPSPTKSALSTPRLPNSPVKDDRDGIISRLQATNFQLERQAQKIRVAYKKASIEYEAQVQKLTQQIINVTNNINKANNVDRAEIEREKHNKELEVQIWKSRNKQNQEGRMNMAREVQKMKIQMELIEEEKFNLESTINEKDIKIFQFQQQISQFMAHVTTTTKSAEQTPKTSKSTNNNLEQIYSTILLFKDKLTSQTVTADWDALSKNILDRSICGQQQSKIINIEQKSRLLSKQMQKLKSQILKTVSKNQQERLSNMNMIKKCEKIIAEIIEIAESLNLNQSSFL